MEFILGRIDLQGGVMDFTIAYRQLAAALLLAVPFAVAAQAPAKPAAAAPAQPPQAATPQAAKPEAAKPEMTTVPPDEKEEVQMSEEEIAKARAADEAVARRKAAEEAAAEHQRQRDAMLARCIIRPVMSDEEIELCRVAYRN